MTPTESSASRPVRPGSSLNGLRELERRYALPTYPRAPVEFVRGEGALLWDSEGREHVDLFSGLSVHNAGHCHPRIVAAISEQAATLAGTSNLIDSEPAMRLVERLVESSLGGRSTTQRDHCPDHSPSVCQSDEPGDIDCR